MGSEFNYTWKCESATLSNLGDVEEPSGWRMDNWKANKENFYELQIFLKNKRYIGPLT